MIDIKEKLIASLKDYPEFLTSNDLVAIGFYRSIDAACFARIKGKGPDFCKIKRKVLYSKVSVIDFFVKHLKDGMVKNQGQRPNGSPSSSG